MAEFHDRELFLIKKALAMAVLTIARNAGPFQAASDAADMKGMLDRLIASDVEMAAILRAARFQVGGGP